jgi:hypothetical protein
VNWKQLVGLVLIAAGIAGFVYGEVSWTKEKHEGNLLGLEFSVKETETREIPKWLSGGVVGLGALLLLAGGRRR